MPHTPCHPAAETDAKKTVPGTSFEGRHLRIQDVRQQPSPNATISRSFDTKTRWLDGERVGCASPRCFNTLLRSVDAHASIDPPCATISIAHAWDGRRIAASPGEARSRDSRLSIGDPLGLYLRV